MKLYLILFEKRVGTKWIYITITNELMMNKKTIFSYMITFCLQSNTNHNFIIEIPRVSVDVKLGLVKSFSLKIVGSVYGN